jgi:ATP-binding cassette subfamily F protein 3
MLQVSNLSKWFGDDCVLDDVSFTVAAGERVGLVGPNGCGKTTLLEIIAGHLEADEGSVRFPATDVRLGYLEQGLTFAVDDTVGHIVFSTQEDLSVLQKRLVELTARLAQAPAEIAPRLLRQYGDTQAQFESQGGYDVTHRAKVVLAGLCLDDVSLDARVGSLSGGQKTRLSLASVLLRRPNLLLLDEPTNHLDISGLEWLEGFLLRFQGAMIIVSHDRTFLDRTVQSVLEINPLTHQARTFGGNYSAYAETVRRERERHQQAYREQQEYIAQVRGEIRKVKGRAKRIEKSTINFYYLKRAKKVARSAVVRERRLQRLLDSEEKLEKPAQGWTMKMDLVGTPVSGQNVLALEHLGHRFDGPFLFREVSLQLQRGERVALVGANGSGKSTMLKLISGQLVPAEGQVRLGTNVHLGYYTQEQEGLNDNSTPFEEIRCVSALSDTETRSFLHYFLFSGDDVFVPVGELSYGERGRLALAKLVLGGSNLLLLDEPINHLDIPSRESFERALSAFEGTVLIVVHDRYFIHRYASALWKISDGTVHRVADVHSQGA